MIKDQGGLTYETGNQNLTVFGSALRDVDENSGDFTNLNCRGVVIVVDVTAEAGAHALVVKIQGKCETSGKYYDILASVSLEAIATTVLRVYPGIAAGANTAASSVLPRTWRVVLDHTKTSSSTMTLSVGACLIR